MVEQNPLRPDLIDGSGSPMLKNKLRRRIKDRVLKCDVPQCWLLNEGDTGLISLDHRYFADGKGRHITMRQVLFQLTYHRLPPEGRLIRMKCDNPTRCISPAHFQVEGWDGPSYADIKRLIYEQGWTTEEDAEEVHCGKEVAAWYRRAREAPPVGRPATFNEA